MQSNNGYHNLNTCVEYPAQKQKRLGDMNAVPITTTVTASPLLCRIAAAASIIFFLLVAASLSFEQDRIENPTAGVRRKEGQGRGKENEKAEDGES